MYLHMQVTIETERLKKEEAEITKVMLGPKLRESTSSECKRGHMGTRKCKI